MSFPGAEERARLAHARRVVVKIGSRLLRDSPVGRTAAIADELAALRKEKGMTRPIVQIASAKKSTPIETKMNSSTTCLRMTPQCSCSGSY